MILDHLENAQRYEALHPRLAAAFDFLRKTDLAHLPLGRHELDGAALYAMVARSPARAREASLLEVHRKYLDVQFIISGVDEMGWSRLGVCTKPEADYDAEKDYRLFQDRPTTWFAVTPGHFTLFFPTDAHAPMTGSGEIHKVVVKVAL